MSIEENKSIVLDFIANISKANYDNAFNILSDDATWWVAGNLPGSGMYPKEKIPEIMSFLSSVFPKGIEITVTHIIGEGDYVAVGGSSHAEIAKDKIYQNTYHWLFEVKGGNIRAIREYMDTLHVKEILYD